MTVLLFPSLPNGVIGPIYKNANTRENLQRQAMLPHILTINGAPKAGSAETIPAHRSSCARAARAATRAAGVSAETRRSRSFAKVKPASTESEMKERSLS